MRERKRKKHVSVIKMVWSSSLSIEKHQAIVVYRTYLVLAIASMCFDYYYCPSLRTTSIEKRFELKEERIRSTERISNEGRERTWLGSRQSSRETARGQFGNFHAIIDIFDHQRGNRNWIIRQLIRLLPVTRRNACKDKNFVEEEHV